MKKPLLGVIVIALSIFASFTVTRTALAYFVGGHITLTEAPEIANIDGEYDCQLQGGSTIVIDGISYFIPSYVTPITGYLPSIGQGILAINYGETIIVCTRDEEGERGGFLKLGAKEPIHFQITLTLPNIEYFGTSETSAI